MYTLYAFIMNNQDQMANSTDILSNKGQNPIIEPSPKQLPSLIGCNICCSNLFFEITELMITIESLSSKDKITILDQQIYRLEVISTEVIKELLTMLKTNRESECKKIEIIEALKLKNKIKTTKTTEKSGNATKLTTFIGKKHEFVEKQAHHYFNLNNPTGDHFSKYHIDHIAQMLYDNFKAEDGSRLNLRTTKAILKLGFNMDIDGVIIIK